MKDYYHILGISANATQADIKERYRILVASDHPDKYQEPARKLQAEERTKEINEAYYVLSDPVRRSRYDRQRTKSTGRRSVQVRTPPSPKTSRIPVEDVIPASMAAISPDFVFSAPRHLHRTFYAMRGDLVRVWLDRRANVLLLDEHEYMNYQRGYGFNYIGGYTLYPQVELLVPYRGRWFLVVDLGGLPGALQIHVELISAGL